MKVSLSRIAPVIGRVPTRILAMVRGMAPFKHYLSIVAIAQTGSSDFNGRFFSYQMAAPVNLLRSRMRVRSVTLQNVAG